MLVGDIIRLTAARYPKKVGVVFEDKKYPWQEVNARVNSLAHGLLKLGLKKQDRTAILCRNCNQYLEFYFAVAKAGLIAVPLNTRFLGKELSYLLNNSGANTLIVDQDYLEVIKGISSELKEVKNYIGLGEGHGLTYDLETLVRENDSEEPRVKVDEEDVFTLGYTSGTTGLPKGAMISQGAAYNAAVTQALELRLRPHDVYLLHARMFFAAGGGVRLHCVLRGCTSIIINFDPKLCLETIEREKVTRTTMGPTQLRMLANHPDFEKHDLSSLGLVGVSAGFLERPLWERLAKVIGDGKIVPIYGLSESATIGTMLQPEEVAFEGPLSRRLGSIGTPHFNIDLRVVDEEGRPVAPDGKQVGELIMRGNAGIMKGYWNQPEASAQALRDGWLHTGDLATVDEDGYIYLVDRKTDMIKSGGINVYPREIENVIYTHPAVATAAVIGVPDDRWGEGIKAIIVLKEGAKATAEEIVELCRRNLASYKKPTSVEFVDSVPMTHTGKVMKKELREKYWKGYERRIH